MLIPSAFEQHDPTLQRALIAAYPVATLVVALPELDIHHIPMVLDGDRLIGHVARANAIASIQGPIDTTSVFAAPPAYVTPSWYAQKPIDSKVVPTTNYASVHVRGQLTLVDDERTHQILTRLTEHFEAGRDQPWAITDAPADYITRMLNGVRGFQIDISDIRAKWKLSQNRPAQDQRQVKAGLGEHPLAQWMLT